MIDKTAPLYSLDDLEMHCVLAASAMEQQCENDQRELRAIKQELMDALEELLYGGLEMEQAMTPAGDGLTAIYPKGTLPRMRELLGRAKLEAAESDTTGTA